LTAAVEPRPAWAGRPTATATATAYRMSPPRRRHQGSGSRAESCANAWRRIIPAIAAVLWWQLPLLRHCLGRPFADIGNQAFLAQRPARHAGVASVQDQPVVRVALVLVGHHLVELLLDLERGLAGRKSGAVADPEDMSIDRDGRFTERDVKHH